MPNLNKVMLMGHLTRDPECKSVGGGTNLATFGLAVNENYTKDGNTVEKTVFLDCEAWGKLAMFCQDYLTKGAAVFIGGRLNQQTWQDKESGKNRSKITITADHIQFAGSKPRAETNTEAPRSEPTSEPKATAPRTTDPTTPVTDDLPF